MMYYMLTKELTLTTARFLSFHHVYVSYVSVSFSFDHCYPTTPSSESPVVSSQVSHEPTLKSLLNICPWYNLKREREREKRNRVFDANPPMFVRNREKRERMGKEGGYMTDSGSINSMNRDAIRDDAK